MDEQQAAGAGDVPRRYRVVGDVPDVSAGHVTAMRFSGANTAALIEWLGMDVPASVAYVEQRFAPLVSFHPDHPGDTCRHGDWIVRYSDETIVIVPPDVFATCYSLHVPDTTTG